MNLFSFDRHRMQWRSPITLLVALAISSTLDFAVSRSGAADTSSSRPNIVLVMTDDQGWGQTGYYNHPVLKTPHLDHMASNGLRFDRFYAGAPVCSPTRASVLTGRTNDRTGVESHGYALRRQEKTLAEVLKQEGYATGHFGKWHLNGLRGAGVPVLSSDPHHPGHFGFDQWLSVTNFFDRDPLMSRQGKFEEFAGDSSDVVVDQAVEFISQQARSSQPFFTVIWFGSPHSPWLASEKDTKAFEALDEDSKQHYGELAAMDRSIGSLQSSLQKLGIADNTLVWFCSDNGGLPKIRPSTVGGLRGNKGTVFEGGLRVPAIVYWPAKVEPRITRYPACTMDIFPTIVDLLGLDPSVAPHVLDGISLKPLFSNEIGPRESPIYFRHTAKAAMVDNRFKLLTQNLKRQEFALYDLEKDAAETTDVTSEHPEVADRMRAQLLAWNDSVEASVAGKDYPEGEVDPNHPQPRFWSSVEAYEPYFPEWKNRWEYRSYLNSKSKRK